MSTDIILSSNTLFHFTNSAEILINILKDGFKPRFCLEDFGPSLLLYKKTSDYEQAVPMTCFCDLPLSKVGSHLKFYGFYGIGLRKSWGLEKGLSPINYIHSNSTQLKYLQQLCNFVFNSCNDQFPENSSLKGHPIISFFEIAGFIKPYEGKMLRNTKYVKKRFYDEREWRYVPFIISKATDLYRLTKVEFLNSMTRAEANSIVAEKFKLPFGPEDVKYIIVSEEKEILALSDALDKMIDKYKINEIKILKTRILSSQQILEDF